MLIRSIFLRGLLLASATAPLSLGCTTPRPYHDYASEPDPRKQEYVLGPSDVLRINVWHNPDLSSEAVVRPDGTISLPLIGDVRAAGRTSGQLRAEIAQRLSTFVKDESATVTVAVTAINSYRFVVSGNVEHAGSFGGSRYVTVSEAIALAGGPNRYASPEQTVIIRSDPAKGKRRIPVDYPGILSGKTPDHDLPVLPGDTVHVP